MVRFVTSANSAINHNGNGSEHDAFQCISEALHIYMTFGQHSIWIVALYAVLFMKTTDGIETFAIWTYLVYMVERKNPLT